jgi:zinc transporter 11
MIESLHPVLQAVAGTLFTWGLTAAGSALVFLFSSGQRKFLDGSLGFAAGVMTAASYWSLLEPALETATSSGIYGDDGRYAFVPVGFGFTAGAIFVYGADQMLHVMGVHNPAVALSVQMTSKSDKESSYNPHTDIEMTSTEVDPSRRKGVEMAPRWRGGGARSSQSNLFNSNGAAPVECDTQDGRLSGESMDCGSITLVSWRRILLLIIAITVHNIPEGLAVGVGFGAIGKSPSATFVKARNLALGIGIQNFPEGLAVSLPLRGSGMSVWRSFWYGQLSGMVEPIAGLFGAIAVVLAEPLLPYTLAFAAGAMIFVVFDDIIPEAQTCGNGKLASAGAVFGFVVMMSLDVGLG